MDANLPTEHDSDVADDDAHAPQGPAAIEVARAAVRVLEEVVAPTVATMGYELVHLEWAATARPRVLRLFVDHPNGMTLDDCIKLSPIVSNALDAAEHGETPEAIALRGVLDAAYVLEVSSPGVERPLSRRSHFDRHTGAKATVRTHAPVRAGSPQKTFHGRIVATTPGAAPSDDREGSVSIADEAGTVHEIPLSLIRRANLVYEPPQAPGARPKTGARAPGSGRPTQQKAVNRG